MEAALKKLAQQEEKYTDELNDALRQYADLKEQAAEFDPEELQDARRALRPATERSAVDRVQNTYGDKYDLLMMHDSKQDVANLLHEEAETCSSVNVCVRNSNNRRSRCKIRRKVETLGSDKKSAGVHFERCTPAFFFTQEMFSEISANICQKTQGD